jgi:hypothetical protein
MNMSSTQGLLFALSWFLMRFGLPILFTTLLIILFSRLDSRWKEQALSRRKQLVQDQVIPMIKCWVFNDCPPEKRENCPAYKEKQVPCWQVFRDQYGTLKDGCLGCDVFRSVPLPILEN